MVNHASAKISLNRNAEYLRGSYHFWGKDEITLGLFGKIDEVSLTSF